MPDEDPHYRAGKLDLDPGCGGRCTVAAGMASLTIGTKLGVGGGIVVPGHVCQVLPHGPGLLIRRPAPPVARSG